MTNNDETPRVWVGCLACYNDGKLTGEWVDAIAAGDLTTEQLHADEGVTINPLYGPHEELWVMNHENFHGILSGECSPMKAQRIAEAISGIDDVQAFEAYYLGVLGAGYGDIESCVASFEDVSKFAGESDRDVTMEIAEELYGFDFQENRWPNRCIDWDYAQRDLEGFTFVRLNGITYAFGDS